MRKPKTKKKVSIADAETLHKNNTGGISQPSFSDKLLSFYQIWSYVCFFVLKLKTLVHLRRLSLLISDKLPSLYQISFARCLEVLFFLINTLCSHAGTSLEDTRLPPRLFASDRFPTKGLNIYSSPDLLPFIRNVLRDTPEFETIRGSCFGKLFDLPARQCPVSCKLIHSFLTRQLLCLPKNTL